MIITPNKTKEFVELYLIYQNKRVNIKIITPNRSRQINGDTILFIYNKLTARDSLVISSGRGTRTPGPINRAPHHICGVYRLFLFSKIQTIVCSIPKNSIPNTVFMRKLVLNLDQFPRTWSVIKHLFALYSGYYEKSG